MIAVKPHPVTHERQLPDLGRNSRQYQRSWSYCRRWSPSCFPGSAYSPCCCPVHDGVDPVGDGKDVVLRELLSDGGLIASLHIHVPA